MSSISETNALARDLRRRHDPDRDHDVFMDVVCHIPIVGAGVLACYGWMQFGGFIAVFAPLQIWASVTASRALHRAITAASYRKDVTAMVGALAAMAVLVEGYGVHLGLVRINELPGVAPFSPLVLLLATVFVGAINLIVRRAFVTGLRNLGVDEMMRAERAEAARAGAAPDHENAKRGEVIGDEWEPRWFEGIVANAERRDRWAQADAHYSQGRGNPVNLTPEQALEIALVSGAWPHNYRPTAEDREALKAARADRERVLASA